MADIPPTDHSTRIEMVELRHYLNQIKDKVALAAVDGTLRGGMAASVAEGVEVSPQDEKTAPMPSMSELRARFPTLTEEEIQEALAKGKEAVRQKEEGAKKEVPPLPPMPSFIAKPKREERPKPPPGSLTKQEEKNRENSIKFSNMLGQM